MTAFHQMYIVYIYTCVFQGDNNCGQWSYWSATKGRI